jgi:hypothetical protein
MAVSGLWSRRAIIRHGFVAESRGKFRSIEISRVRHCGEVPKVLEWRLFAIQEPSILTTALFL